MWFFGAKFIMPLRIPATKTHKEWQRPKMIQLFGHRSGKPFAKMHFVCLLACATGILMDLRSEVRT